MTTWSADRSQPAPSSAADWWRDAAVYQIYPRSFADSNGDGIGDLPGITSRVGYLKALGIDAVWLSPFYPSALADGGYDVDEYRDVDPLLGTLGDFDELVASLHAVGIKVIVDIVPNHTSDRHQFFQEALTSPAGSPARDRYIFRDGLGPNGDQPPSDWPSLFGGSAWERVPDGQWYLHLFAKEQPDLNWDNREVRDEFLETLRFWSDRGADGFRVDVAHGLAKELSDPLPSYDQLPDALLPGGGHPFWDRDEVHGIYAEWRKVFNEYDPPRSAVAEAWVHRQSRAKYATSNGLGQAFNFDLLEADWHLGQFQQIIAENLAEVAETGASTTWVLSNHDVVRHPTRYGFPPGENSKESSLLWLLSDGQKPPLDRSLGLRRGRAATLLTMALPGSVYLYQGEELGLHEVGDLPPEVLEDPVFVRSGGRFKGRDGCRVPLPWTVEPPSFGFSDSTRHLPQPAWFAECSVQAQRLEEGSTLNLYRRALGLRRLLRPDGEDLAWADSTGPDVLHFRRPGGWHSLTNFGSEPVDLPSGDVVISSDTLEADRLPPNTTAWIVVPGD